MSGFVRDWNCLTCSLVIAIVNGSLLVVHHVLVVVHSLEVQVVVYGTIPDVWFISGTTQV